MDSLDAMSDMDSRPVFPTITRRRSQSDSRLASLTLSITPLPLPDRKAIPLASRAPSQFGSPVESRRSLEGSGSAGDPEEEEGDEATPKSTVAPTVDSSSLPSPSDTASASNAKKSVVGQRARLAARGSFSTLSFQYGGGASLKRMPLLLQVTDPLRSLADPHTSSSGSSSDVDFRSENDPPGRREGGQDFSLALKREKRTGESSEIASSWAPIPSGALFGGLEARRGEWQGWEGKRNRRRQVVGREEREGEGEGDSLGEYWIEDQEHEHYERLHGHDGEAELDLDKVSRLLEDEWARQHPHQDTPTPTSPSHPSSTLVPTPHPSQSPDRLLHPLLPSFPVALPPPADEDAVATVWALVGMEKEERMRREEEEWGGREDEFAGAGGEGEGEDGS